MNATNAIGGAANRFAQVQASVFGDRETRKYEFVVDTGSTYLALPPEEIEALGLRRTNGTVRLGRHRDGGCRNIFRLRRTVRPQVRRYLVPAATPLLG